MGKDIVNREDIIRFCKTCSRPLSFRKLAEDLGISKKHSRTLKRELRQLVKEGEIVRTRKGLYGPAEEMNLCCGHFESHREGYGFVILEKPGERDIFIPSRSTMGAMDNDRVMVRVEHWRRREGRIIRILERAHNRVAGKIEVERKAIFLKPKNKKVPFDIYIPPNQRGKAKAGDTAVVEITHYPTDTRSPSGRVIKVIQRPEDPKSEIEAIIDEFNIPRRFPREVLTEAKRLGEEAESLPVKKRKDLTALKTVTIDGERAKDFDDAVSIALTRDGYKLYVHIADVSHYVPWDSTLDLEARSRGTSFYFPERVIPMLPKILSEELCSLKPGVRKMAFTVEMDFDRSGNRLAERFYPSVIISNERMTYTSVRKILTDNDGKECQRYEDLLDDFELMAELCGLLRRKRLERGSLDFDLPEPEVIIDLMGKLEAIIKAERNLAHMIIEEFMIAANETVAEYIEKRGIPSLYRIHEKPDERKLDEVLQVLRGVTDIRRHTLSPDDIPSLLSTLKGHPSEEVINYIVLRSLKQARYSPVNIEHFGLASASYTHFTSPIRRYPDLMVHRILREILVSKKGISDKRIGHLETVLPDIASHSSRMERLADEAEREVIDAMKAWFMKDHVGEEFDGRIIGIAPYGMRIRLKEFYVEGFLHVSYMTDDYYFYNEHDLTFVGKHTKRRYAIGQEVRVRIDRVDLEEREIIFSIV